MSPPPRQLPALLLVRHLRQPDVPLHHLKHIQPHMLVPSVAYRQRLEPRLQLRLLIALLLLRQQQHVRPLPLLHLHPHRGRP